MSRRASYQRSLRPKRTDRERTRCSSNSPCDTANYSYTWYVRDLSSLGEVIVGTTRVVTYGGGALTIYVDFLPSNHDYGVNPPNATSPSTFTDGFSTYLDGVFTA